MERKKEMELYNYFIKINDLKNEKDKKDFNIYYSLFNLTENKISRHMPEEEYMNYITGFIFYKYLSEKITYEMNKKLFKYDINFVEAFKSQNIDSYGEKIKEISLNELGYFIKPKNLFTEILKSKNGNYIKKFNLAFNEIEYYGNKLDDIFLLIDLKSNKIGKTDDEKNQNIYNLISSLDKLNLNIKNGDNEKFINILELLINLSNNHYGIKRREINHTPKKLSNLLAKIISCDKKEIDAAYDSTCKIGSELLELGNEVTVKNYYGQTPNQITYNLVRMNMIMHDIPLKNLNLYLEDCLITNRTFPTKMDAIVSVPPFGLKWDYDKDLINDERYSKYGVLPPKRDASFAFIENMIYQLSDDGVMAIITPVGTLFRGSSENRIRKCLIKDDNYLDAVILLPSKLSNFTMIPSVLVVFKKNRSINDKILFINASNDYEVGKKLNSLRDEDVNKILDTYNNRKEISRYSHNASIDEIESNDFNLNIPRYIDTFEVKDPIDVEELSKQLEVIKRDISSLDNDFYMILDKLKNIKN